MAGTNTSSKPRMSKRKKIAAASVGILATALLIGGAFAWKEFSQNAINKFRGGVTPDALLHDDFQPWENKDVYVENPGEQPIIVRIKFNEYLQIGNEAIIGTDSKDRTTWVTHKFNQDTDFTDCGLDSHQYFNWEMTGNKKVFLPGTSEFGDFKYTVGEVGPNGNTAKETLEASKILTMKEWIALSDTEKDTVACWVLDEDGWAYWSQLLLQGDATNLLLDNVTLSTKPDDNFYYAIDVIMNTTNRTEYKELYADATPDAINNIVDVLAAKSANKYGLKQSIAKAEAAVAKSTDYNTADATWQTMLDALQAAKQVEANTSSKQDQIDAAKKALDDAFAAIKPLAPTADKSALQTAIAGAETVKTNSGEYNTTDATWQAMLDALKNANTVNNNANATEKEIEDAKTALEDAIASLVKGATLTLSDKWASATWDSKVALGNDGVIVDVHGDANDDTGWTIMAEGDETIIDGRNMPYIEIPLNELFKEADVSNVTVSVKSFSGVRGLYPTNPVGLRAFITNDGLFRVTYLPTLAEINSAGVNGIDGAKLMLPAVLTFKNGDAEVDFTVNMRFAGQFEFH